MLFSVVIPLYNKETTVARAIRSVLAQTYQNFEIVVIDDGSNDSGPQIVRDFHDPRTRLIQQSNAGVSAARNRGISEAAGDFVAFLDADDEWQADHLAQFARLHATFPDCAVFASRYWLERDPEHRRAAIVSGLDPEFEGILTNYFRIASRSEPPLWTSAISARRSALLDVGGFPLGVTSGEDLLTWAKLASQTAIAFSMRPTSIFHLAACHYFCGYLDERRLPQELDIVGDQLATMCRDIPRASAKDFRRFVARWHQMRAQIFLLAGKRSKASRALFRSFLYDPCQPKLAAYFALMLVPRPAALATYRALSRSADI